MHIGSNLPPKDNLQKEDKSSAPKVSFVWRFHCNINEPHIFIVVGASKTLHIAVSAGKREYLTH